MQRTDFPRRLSARTIMSSTPFSSMILTPAELYRFTQNPNHLSRINDILGDQDNDLRSHLYYFISLNRTIDSLQNMIDEHRSEMRHVYNDLTNDRFVRLIGPEILHLQPRSINRRLRRTRPYYSPSSSSEEYFSAASAILQRPSPRFYGDILDLNEPVVPLNDSPPSSSPGSVNNPIDVDSILDPISSVSPTTQSSTRPICPREGHEDCDIGHPEACLSCHYIGHDFADCPIEPLDLSPINTSSIETPISDAPIASGSALIPRDLVQQTMAGRLLVTCGNCSRTGHSMAECIFSGPFRCSICEQVGHIARDCTSQHAIRRRSSSEEYRVWQSRT
jgi:hypothetical protein